MTTFDPQAFLSQQTDAPMDTQFTPVPAGEFPAVIKAMEARQQPSSKNPSELWTILDLTYVIDDEGVRQETGLPEPTIRQSLFLDIDDDGKLDNGKGKNVNLGRLREALGLNKEGEVFSFDMLVGQACIISVKHNPDKNDPSLIYANVNKVASLS